MIQGQVLHRAVKVGPGILDISITALLAELYVGLLHNVFHRVRGHNFQTERARSLRIPIKASLNSLNLLINYRNNSFILIDFWGRFPSIGVLNATHSFFAPSSVSLHQPAPNRTWIQLTEEMLSLDAMDAPLAA